MQPSDIAWTDYTWNPTHGCSKVEPPDGESGCTNCYAERLSRRYNHTEHKWTNEYAEENVPLLCSVAEPSHGDYGIPPTAVVHDQ